MLGSQQNAAESTRRDRQSSLTSSFEQTARPLDHKTHSFLVAVRPVLLLALVFAFAAKGFLPSWKHMNSDFPNYYLVAKLHRLGYPLEQVYDWTWLQRQNDHLGVRRGLVSYSPSTLTSALPIWPLTFLSPLTAKRVWLIENLFFLGLTLSLCARMSRLGGGWICILAFLAFMPLRNNFLLGQMHILVLLFITISAWLYFEDSQFWSGISLAAAAALKIYPALFLVYFAWKRQWRAAVGLTLGAVALAAISLSLFGANAWIVYIREVLPAGLRGETLDPYNPAWNSFTALFKRLFIYEPTLNPRPVLHSSVLYAVLQPLIHITILVAFMCAIGRRKGDMERTKLEYGAFLFLLLFLSSQPGVYHLVVLILAATLVGNYLLVHQQHRVAACALVLYALVGGPLLHIPGLVPAGWQNLLFFPRLAWMSMLAAILCWTLAQFHQSLTLRNAVLAMSCVIVLTFVGFVSTMHHLRGQFENYSRRIVAIQGDLLATDPAIKGQDVLFTHMDRGGYTIDQAVNRTVTDMFSGPEDNFHPAASPISGVVWLEHASPGVSRIVRVDNENVGEAAQTLEIDNAQQPVISPDGQFLAFLREKEGRNVLMVKVIGQSKSQAAGSVYQVAGAEYDVSEATFTRRDNLIFSSHRQGKFSLYLSSLDGKVQPLGMPDCSARYPAASRDGKWLAFSCEQRGNWHLMVARLDGAEKKELTAGDCNSVSPAWTLDSKRLVYATDCGRGLGLTALAQIEVIP